MSWNFSIVDYLREDPCRTNLEAVGPLGTVLPFHASVERVK